MALWNRRKNGITDQQKLIALRLATDEDFSLDEVVQKFSDLATARAVIEDLYEDKMVEFYWKRPKGDRVQIPVAEVTGLLEDDTEWVRSKSFQEPYVIVVANDRGWRWFQSHWKSE